uniref:Glutathione hydrolase n=1 Tax=Oryza meridionalis TaxID=40149 RepID=A0A0E0BX70_9ORYZ
MSSPVLTTAVLPVQNGQLAGVVGGSGGTNIIATATQVFLNHFIVGMDPLAAVQHPRLVPNEVVYENETVVDGEVIELSGEAREFLRRRGHRLRSTGSGAVCQFIVQDLLAPVGSAADRRQHGGGNVFHGMLTAVSDPRKGGRPAGIRRRRPCTALAIAAAALLALAACVVLHLSSGGDDRSRVVSGGGGGVRLSPHEVEAGVGAVATDDGRCSEVGAAALRAGGHAVDAAVAATLCLGVVHPMSSGVGGGAFIIARDAASGDAVAFDARETAPAAATPDMYAGNPTSKYKGALAMGIPGELAGLHAAWSRYGRLPWKDLFAPAIKLARDGFTVVPPVAGALKEAERDVLADPGLRAVFAPQGRILAAGEVCRNPALADTLEAVASGGVEVFYGGAIGERFVADVRRAGGIATVDDLRAYKVEVSDAMRSDAMGYTFLGMPPPSSGTVGMALVLNILDGYKSLEFLKGFLGVHRFIEALKHMLAIRMALGDPDYVNVAGNVSEMLSPAFADKIRQRIVDNTTFPPSYYFPKWSQLNDHGTSHLCVVDGDRNAVAMTTTVNSYFGAHVLSPSTGIVVNNEMDDFSVPAERTPDHLPPAPANFIAPGKRPISSMTPTIILKASI